MAGDAFQIVAIPLFVGGGDTAHGGRPGWCPHQPVQFEMHPWLVMPVVIENLLVNYITSFQK